MIGLEFKNQKHLPNKTWHSGTHEFVDSNSKNWI